MAFLDTVKDVGKAIISSDEAGLEFSDDIVANAIISISRLGQSVGLLDNLIGGSGFNVLGELSQMLTRPRLGVIDINCDQYEVIGENDVPESMVISQISGSTENPKKYVTDSVAPHPRTFRLHGYIESLIPILENGILIKPTLLMQKQYIEALRMSRTWFKFRTKDAETLKVIMQRLSIKEDPKVQNAFEIDVTLREFNLLEAVFDIKQLSGMENAPTSVTLSSSSFVDTSFRSIALIAAPLALSLTKDTVGMFMGGGNAASVLFNTPGNAFSLPLSNVIAQGGGNPYAFNYNALGERERGQSIKNPGPYQSPFTGEVIAGTGSITYIPDSTINVPVESLTIDRSGIVDVPYDRMIKMSCIVSPANASNKLVEWASSNPSVATVNAAGEVTSLMNNGTSIISVASASNPEITESFTIRVSSSARPGDTVRAIHVDRISVQPSTDFVLRQGAIQGLKVTVFPFNAMNKAVDTTSSNDGVAMIDEDMNIRAVANGTTVVIITSRDNLSASVVINVEVANDGTNGNGGNRK